MTTRCKRQGQVEIGIIEHQGREYAGLGATVQGRHLTAYTKVREGRLTLTTWCGRTMLACRSEDAAGYADGSLAVVFSLTKRRYIAGYALAEDGMLFRGELVTDCSVEAAHRAAVRIADYFSELDAEDEAETVWE